VQDFTDSEAMKAKAAAAWLYLVAAATLLNSLIMHKCTRFIDLLGGLSFTQFIDAIFVGRWHSSSSLHSKRSPVEILPLPALGD
jgi:hypothetical protein